jgi:hypothetical protein
MGGTAIATGQGNEICLSAAIEALGKKAGRIAGIAETH